MQSDLHDFVRQIHMISNLLDHHQFPDPTLPAAGPITTSDLGKLHLEPITDKDLENHAKRWAKEHDFGVVPQALATSICQTNYPDVNEVHLQSRLERVLHQSPFFGDPDGDVYPLRPVTHRPPVRPTTPTPGTRRPTAASTPAANTPATPNQPSAEDILHAAVAWANSHDGNVTMPDFSIHLRGTKFPRSSLRSLGQQTSRFLTRDPRFTRQAPGHFTLT